MVTKMVFSIYKPRRLDFSQDEATQELINFHPSEKNIGKWPTEFDNKTISLEDKQSKDKWDVTLSVSYVDMNDMIRRDIQYDPAMSSTSILKYQKPYIPKFMLVPCFWILSKLGFYPFEREYNYVMTYTQPLDHCVYIKHLYEETVKYKKSSCSKLRYSF